MSQSPIQSCRSLQALYRQLCMGDWAMSENAVLVSFNQTCLPLLLKIVRCLKKNSMALFFVTKCNFKHRNYTYCEWHMI